MLLNGYDTEGFYDEMFDAAGRPRAESQLLLGTISALGDGQLQRCQQAAERILVQLGITFNVYGESAGTERPFPFDLVPRIVSSQEWDWIERGLKQRIHALNTFIDDVYHEQRILKDGVIPEDVVRTATFFGLSARESTPRRAWGATSRAPIWSAIPMVRSMSSRTTCACRLASRTCSRTEI